MIAWKSTADSVSSFSSRIETRFLGDGATLNRSFFAASFWTGDGATEKRSVFFGEVALSGAVRPVARMEQRLKEAERLGFERAFVPEGAPTAVDGLTVTPIKRLIDLVELLAPDALNA